MSSGTCAGHPPCLDDSHCCDPRLTLTPIAGRVRGCSGGGTCVAYAVLTNELDHVVSFVCVACYSSTLHTWGEGRNPAGIPGVSHWLVMKECALRIPYGGMVSDARGRVWQVPPRGIVYTVPCLPCLPCPPCHSAQRGQATPGVRHSRPTLKCFSIDRLAVL